jgi:spore coat polysaccharide biosynthesis protein SpsF (cytidylyltransferase family)
VHAPSIIAVIQVRLNSSRLPGKAMRGLRGRTILGHVVDRLRQCRTLDGLWIATSTDPADDAVAAFAESEGVNLHRGSLDDVASRLLTAALAADADALVRINADSPLIDPAIVDRAVTLYRRERPDLVSNVLRRTFPKGQSVEVISVSALARAHQEMTSAEEREHVTPWFYANPARVRIVGFESASPREAMQLSVDTAEDLRRIEAILSRLSEPAAAHGLDAILAAADCLEPSRS